MAMNICSINYISIFLFMCETDYAVCISKCFCSETIYQMSDVCDIWSLAHSVQPQLRTAGQVYGLQGICQVCVTRTRAPAVGLLLHPPQYLPGVRLTHTHTCIACTHVRHNAHAHKHTFTCTHKKTRNT